MVEVIAWSLLAWFVVGFGVALIVGELLYGDRVR